MSGYGTFVCDNCGRAAAPGEQKYILKIEMFASPDPPAITDEMLEGDPKQKIKELVEHMQKMNPQELEDQVFEAYVFALCPACREQFHHGLNQLKGKKKFL
ncbi:MAG: hypothetical protein Kow0059_12480 [Candidatus Sumerlaeia bacterium]